MVDCENPGIARFDHHPYAPTRARTSVEHGTTGGPLVTRTGDGKEECYIDPEIDGIHRCSPLFFLYLRMRDLSSAAGLTAARGPLGRCARAGCGPPAF